MNPKWQFDNRDIAVLGLRPFIKDTLTMAGIYTIGQLYEFVYKKRRCHEIGTERFQEINAALTDFLEKEAAEVRPSGTLKLNGTIGRTRYKFIEFFEISREAFNEIGGYDAIGATVEVNDEERVIDGFGEPYRCFKTGRNMIRIYF